MTDEQIRLRAKAIEQELDAEGDPFGWDYTTVISRLAQETGRPFLAIERILTEVPVPAASNLLLEAFRL